jgi:uncharacterized protein (DUF433 family)
MDYNKYIEIAPEIRFGKPCVKGTRITVFDVLGWMASGMSIEEIIKDYLSLSKKQIQACLAYSADKERKVSYTVGMKLLIDENISYRILRLIDEYCFLFLLLRGGNSKCLPPFGCRSVPICLRLSPYTARSVI